MQSRIQEVSRNADPDQHHRKYNDNIKKSHLVGTKFSVVFWRFPLALVFGRPRGDPVQLIQCAAQVTGVAFPGKALIQTLQAELAALGQKPQLEPKHVIHT